MREGDRTAAEEQALVDAELARYEGSTDHLREAVRRSMELREHARLLCEESKEIQERVARLRQHT